MSQFKNDTEREKAPGSNEPDKSSNYLCLWTSKDENFVLLAFQVVLLSPESLNGNQKLSVKIIFYEKYTTTFGA